MEGEGLSPIWELGINDDSHRKRDSNSKYSSHAIFLDVMLLLPTFSPVPMLQEEFSGSLVQAGEACSLVTSIDLQFRCSSFGTLYSERYARRGSHMVQRCCRLILSLSRTINVAQKLFDETFAPNSWLQDSDKMNSAGGDLAGSSRGGRQR